MSDRKKRVARARAALEGQLQEQLGVLEKSAALYDAGDKVEAKRLASTLRILLADAGRCRSLLGQLGMLGLAFTNTNRPPSPRNRADHMGLLAMRLAIEGGKASGSYEPLCLGGPSVIPGAMPFPTWWERDVVLTVKPDVAATREIRHMLPQESDGLATPCSQENLVVQPGFEELSERVPHRFAVIDNQDPRHRQLFPGWCFRSHLEVRGPHVHRAAVNGDPEVARPGDRIQGLRVPLEHRIPGARVDGERVADVLRPDAGLTDDPRSGRWRPTEASAFGTGPALRLD